MRILYLAHDLDDAAIWRRVAMLEAGGASVSVAGFRRGSGALERPALVLGQTANGRMVARMRSVAALVPQIRARLEASGVETPDLVLARNLEMLALGRSYLRGRAAIPLIYELLDIHRLMIGQGRVARGLRKIEAWLMARCALVLVSSQGFVRHYLERYRQPARAVALVENKPLMLNGPGPATARTAPITPNCITIGWFGILRCQWTLETLDLLTRRHPGRFHIVLRGKPALDVLPKFHETVADNPDMSFEGAYRWPDDLPEIYSACDMAMLIDRYDAGANSDWLLPNRLYEGCLFGAVPISLSDTELGHSLAARGVGLRVTSPEATIDSLAAVTPEALAGLRATLAGLPRETWYADATDCADLVERLRECLPTQDAADPPQKYVA
ncbi:glycosyl transferase [Thioclava dalianensis]|uniref:Glycosyl transferase n=1 Tax=Thioclava dalianensis TaxID=1185766 RepID=A0A074TIC8_9RHOB|nr:glycosyltransferase [Thioclava dalianensis]KEP71399.1 glycosyl transferase [Thioclava dalianensis]SFM79172.1 succinoglycan biosynthesis protein ExoA/succinoglycan biosynthesis protein ExoL [Thioclava dalianensis]